MADSGRSSTIESPKRQWPATVSLAAGVLSLLAFAALWAVLRHPAPAGQRADLSDIRAMAWARWLCPVVIGLGLVAIALALGVGSHLPSRRAARSGRALGAVGVMVGLLGWASVPLRGGHYSARKVQCLSNMRKVVLAVQMYAQDYGRYPEGATWSDALRESVGSSGAYRCPEGTATGSYAYNQALTRLPGNSPATTDRIIAIFESDRGWNAHGGQELLPAFPRHLGGDNIGFADGHAKWYARQKPSGGVRWNSVWPREYQDEGELQWQPVRKRRAE